MKNKKRETREKEGFSSSLPTVERAILERSQVLLITHYSTLFSRVTHGGTVMDRHPSHICWLWLRGILNEGFAKVETYQWNRGGASTPPLARGKPPPWRPPSQRFNVQRAELINLVIPRSLLPFHCTALVEIPKGFGNPTEIKSFKRRKIPGLGLD